MKNIKTFEEFVNESKDSVNEKYNDVPAIIQYLEHEFDLGTNPKEENLAVSNNGSIIEVTTKSEVNKGKYEDLAKTVVSSLENEFGIKYKIEYANQDGFRLSSK